jgi:tryptophan synthase alpha chain
MNRIDETLNALREKGEKALGLFLTAGFPERDSTTELVLSLQQGGADLLEIGMPFSDPIADGPVIQQSSAIALGNGVTLDTIFDDVRQIRKSSSIPIVLMGYLNPILCYGREKFFQRASECGVDGIILPEVPLEESAEFSVMHDVNGLAQILLVTPASPGERIGEIDRRSSGFLYCVSSTGVTGSRSGHPAAEYLAYVRRHAEKNPLLVGFGIATPEDARASSVHSDGVIIGSALIRFVAGGPSREEIIQWVRQFKKGLRRNP